MFPLRFICSVILPAVLIAGSALAAPKLEVSETEFDFGFVPQHARVTHLFWLKSTGDATLNISEVDPGCSCTKTPLEKRVLPVGDSTLLQLIFRTQYYRQPVKKHPKIYVTGSKAPTQLTFTAVVTARPDSTYPVIVTPYKLDVSQISERPITGGDFTVTNRTDQPLEATLVSGWNPLFTLKLPETIPPGESAPGHLTLTEEGRGRTFEASFTFELNDAKKSRFTVPVKRTLKGVAASPFDTAPE